MLHTLRTRLQSNFFLCYRTCVFRSSFHSSSSLFHKPKDSQTTVDINDHSIQESNNIGSTFKQIGISDTRLQILNSNNLEKMFPIQERTYKSIREGKDIVGRAKTGTGKTLAYLLPLIERYENWSTGGPNIPFILILVPTRELSVQVNKEINRIAPKLKAISVYGGQPVNAQAKNISKNVDIIVGTPGRILHLIQDNIIQLQNISAFVLDEADQMLDIGFKRDLEIILNVLPREKQTLLFSATLPAWVKDISKRFFKDPEIIDLVEKSETATPKNVSHQFIQVSLPAQRIIVLSKLIARYRNEKMLVFVNTRADCSQIAASPLISFAGRVRSLHGEIKQEERASILEGFRNGVHNVLIATDVAARGLDISNIDMVVHYHVARSTETYIHRSGRCGRAGKFGLVISIVGGKEKFLLEQLRKHLKFNIQQNPIPSETDIINTSVNGIKDTLNSVNDLKSKNYIPLANQLLKENGVDAFAKALCILAGHHTNSYSLLNGTEGYTTLKISSSKDSISKASAVSYLHKLGGKDFGLAQLCPDGSTVIDCESNQVPDILKAIKKQRNESPITIEIIKELPEVIPNDNNTLSFRQGAISMHEKYSPILKKSK